MPLPKLKQPDNHTNFNSGGQPPAGVKLTTLSYLLGARAHPWWTVNYILGVFSGVASSGPRAGLVSHSQTARADGKCEPLRASTALYIVADALYSYRRSHRA